MLSRNQNLWRARRPVRHPSFFFSRPLLLLQSDDWGRVGVRDLESSEQLRSAGIVLGQKPYDFYTLERAEDVSALADLLKAHHDSSGRAPCLEMNFILANVDFPKACAATSGEVPLRSLAEGLPGSWKRPGLFEAYASGIADGVFYPALHGISHFCRSAIARSLRRKDERSEFLHALWQAETPYIYWRMPWIGYEYWDPEQSPGQRFLPAADQRTLIGEAASSFKRLFFRTPTTACAPGYRANVDTYRAWVEHGIRVVQNGTRLFAPYFDERGLLQISRTIDFEPAVHASFSLQKCLRAVGEAFRCGIPAVVSVHSINFHSSLKNFRDTTLCYLGEFLSTVEAKYPDLLYVHDSDLWDSVNSGRYEVDGRTTTVTVKQSAPQGSLAMLDAG